MAGAGFGLPLVSRVGPPVMVAEFLGGRGVGAGVVVHAILGAVLLSVLRVAFKIGPFIVAPGTGIMAGASGHPGQDR